MQYWNTVQQTNAVDLDAARRNRERIAKGSKPKKAKGPTKEFFASSAWVMLRYKALKRDGGRCLCCGRSAKDGAVLQVDHIRSRTKYPELALKLNNLQVLCSTCNQGKGWQDQTDWH